MRGLIVFSCLAFAAACRGAPPSVSLDSAAGEYVRLARALERNDPMPVAAIAAARDRVAGLQERDGRRGFLLAQLHALERRARFLAGEAASIRDEAQSLGLSLPAYDADRVATLRAELESALPGRAPLGERLAAHRRSAAIPRSQLEAVSRRLIDDCRGRVPAPNDLSDAGLELRYVVDTPWPAYTSYDDGGRSTVAIRRDVSWSEDTLLRVLCHETYPGHHLQNLIWDDLRDKRRWQEFSVTPAFTPHAVMAERSAIAATALVVPRAMLSVVSRILDDLSPYALATAVEIADGRIDRAAGLARLRDELLMPDANGFLAFVERYRSMAVAYTMPAPDIRHWDGYFALLRSPQRLVAGVAHEVSIPRQRLSPTYVIRARRG